MSGYERAGDHVDRGYILLADSVADGAAELAASGKQYGVLLDSAGRPQMLLGVRGLSAPAIVIDASTPMTRLLAPDIVAFLNSGAPGLVLMDDSKIVGVLSATAIIGYLMDHSSVRASDPTPADSALYGDAPVAPLTLTCSTCGTVNKVVFFVAGETPCSKGHPLFLKWE